jgi:hypothetical protein
VLEGFKGSFMEIWIAIALVLAFLSTVDFEGTRRTRHTRSYEADYSLYDPKRKI